MLIPLMRNLFWPIAAGEPQRPSPKTDGQFVERLRKWSKSLAGGVETNVVLAK